MPRGREESRSWGGVEESRSWGGYEEGNVFGGARKECNSRAPSSNVFVGKTQGESKNADWYWRDVHLAGGKNIHYETVKLVHQPVYEYAKSAQEKEWMDVEGYDMVKDAKERVKAQTVGSEKTGAEKEKELRYWLDNLGLKRTVHQVQFNEKMIKACLPKIYEKEWESDCDRIMKEHGITRIKKEICFSCPRRWGKTYSVAIFAAAFLLVIPSCRVSAFATGRRTARKLMLLILSFLVNYPKFQDVIKTKNQEEARLSFSPTDERVLECNPSTVKVSTLLFSLHPPSVRSSSKKDAYPRRARIGPLEMLDSNVIAL